MQANFLGERKDISFTQAKKLSQCKIKDGVFRNSQNTNFELASKYISQGKQINYFKQGDDDLIGFNIKGLTNKLIDSLNLNIDQIWAVEQYENDYTLTNINNHTKTNFDFFYNKSSKDGSSSLTDVKINASRRLDKVKTAFEGNNLRFIILNNLVLENYSIRALQRKHKKRFATIKKFLIEAIEMLTEIYKTIKKV